MWLLISLSFVRLCVAVFFFVHSLHFIEVFALNAASWTISRQKGAHRSFFSVTSQARSVPFFSFFLFLIQFLVCKTFLILFFFFFSVVCCDSKDHFSILCSHSSFVKKPGFMQNTHASFDHKGSCWCIKIWICMRVCVCYFFRFLFFISSHSDAFFASTSMA